MPELNIAPAVSLYSALAAAPLRPLHTLMRTTEERMRPAQPAPHRSRVMSAQVALLARDPALADSRAVIRRELSGGRVPTIVLGGLVPDASEQVFLLRRFLLRSGDVYYVHYPRNGFSLPMLCAQLDDLVEELRRDGRPPVIFAVSFGAGIVIDWLRRAREAGRSPLLSGVVLVSPVTCVADLIAPGAPKAKTLLGRALQPYLNPTAPVAENVVEKSRALFLRMFEAGAQNKAALRLLMTAAEMNRLRDSVLATIRNVSSDGARQRAQALTQMIPLTNYFQPQLLPLTEAPTLVLFAECEDAVLDADAPVRLALERATAAYFSNSSARCVRARPGTPAVQHASLVFHVFEFLPSLRAFYQLVRRASLPFAA